MAALDAVVAVKRRKSAIKQRHQQILDAGSRGRRRAVSLNPLDALKQRRMVREQEGEWEKGEVQVLREQEQAQMDQVARRVAGMSQLLGTGRSTRRRRAPTPEEEAPESALLQALKSKKAAEDSLLLGDKRWCKKCQASFVGAVCARNCPTFMYLEAVPEEQRQATVAAFHQQRRAEEAEQKRLAELAKAMRPKSPPKVPEVRCYPQRSPHLYRLVLMDLWRAAGAGAGAGA